MKRLLFVFLAIAASAFSAPAKVKVLQVEYVRSNAYRPDPSAISVPITDLTPAAVLKLDPGISAHATEVAQLLTSGPAANLVESIQLSEAVSFEGNGNLNGTRSFDPIPATWEIENHSWGNTDQLFGIDILTKEAQRLQRDNVIAIVGPPNGPIAGQPADPAYIDLCNLQSAYAIRVGSTTTPMVLTAMDQPQVYEPFDYVSYCIPRDAEVCIEEISWCKTNLIHYAAWALVRFVISSAIPDASGHPVVNEKGAMTALTSFYNVVGSPLGNTTSTVTPVAATVLLNHVASFSVTADGTPPFLYQWEKNSVPIPGATSATYTIASAQASDAGTYSVLVANPAGNTVSNNAILTVSAPTSTTTAPPTTTSSTTTIPSTSTTTSTSTIPTTSVTTSTSSAFTSTIATSSTSSATTTVPSTSTTSVATTSIPTPTPKPAPNAIAQFSSWNNYWAGPTTPATLWWQLTPGVAVSKVELIDPFAVAIDVTAVPTFVYSGMTLRSAVITTLSATQVTWTLRVTLPDGTIQTKTFQTAGRFSAAQVAALNVSPPVPTPAPSTSSVPTTTVPTPTPTPIPIPTTTVPTPSPSPTPTPSPDDLRSAAAKATGSSYDPSSKEFTVPAGEVHALSDALTNAGL